MNTKQLLYIMRCGNTRLFKIGVSSHPEKRRAQLQTGCPWPIKLLFQLSMDEDIKASNVERVVHDHLRAKRAMGEWFQLSDQDVLKLAHTLLSVGQNRKHL